MRSVRNIMTQIGYRRKLVGLAAHAKEAASYEEVSLDR